MQHICGTLDRPGHELRKEGDKESVADEISLWPDIPAIDVNAVAERLQSIK